MKGRIIFILFFLLAQVSFGRYWPYFAEYRNVPADTLFLSKAIRFIHQEQLDSAETALSRSIAYHEEHSNLETRHLIKNIYATFLFEHGNKDKALAITSEIINEQQPPYREQAFSHYTRARVFLARKQYNKALASIQQGIQLLTSLQDTTPVLLYNYFFKASLSRKTGQRAQAIGILDTIRNIAHARDDYNSLGTCYYEYSKLMDDYQHGLRAEFLQLAIDYFEKAGTILEEYKRLYLYCHFNLAKTYFHYLEKYEQSLALWEKSMQLVNGYQVITASDRKRKMVWLTGIYSYRARVLTAMGKAREALAFLNWQQPVVEKEYGAKSVKMSLLLANKAKAYLALQQYDSAFHCLDKVYEARTGNRWSADSRVSNYLLPLARAYQATGQWQKSLATAHEGICCLSDTLPGQVGLLHLPHLREQSMGDQYDVFTLLLFKMESMRRIYAGNKDLIFLLAAHETGTKTDSLLQTFVDNTVLWFSGVKLSAAFHRLYNHTQETSLDLYRATGKDIYKENAFYYLCRSQSNYLQFEMHQLELLSARDTGGGKVENARLKQKIRELENLTSPGNAPRDIDKQLLDLKVRLLFNQFNRTKAPASIHRREDNAFLAMDQLRQAMKEKTLMLAYRMNGEDSSLLIFAADRDSIIFTRKKADPGFFGAINQFKRQVKTGYPTARVSSILANHLLAPVSNCLAGKEKLVIIPSGPLVEIPFEAIWLPSSPGDKEGYLVEKFAVSYHFSPNLWFRDQVKTLEADQLNRKILAMAPGFLDDSSAFLSPASPFRDMPHREIQIIQADDRLAPLPYSLEEVSRIKQIAKNAGYPIMAFQQEEASITNFRRYAKGAGILHISTHGYSACDDPLQSGIFLCPPGGDSSQQLDGYLSLQDIYQLDTQAELVVLSACKSGHGKIVPGEGMLALPRGFLHAGVPNIMSSLWKVHDEKTKELMVLYYQYLLSGKYYAEALRLAKLQFIKKGELPMDWAGMVLIGL